MLHSLVSHLSEQVCQLCVDLGPEGGACHIDEGLSVHFPSHFQLLQSSQGFLFRRLKPLGDNSWMKTLQQEIKGSYIQFQYLQINRYSKQIHMPN